MKLHSCIYPITPSVGHHGIAQANTMPNACLEAITGISACSGNCLSNAATTYSNMISYKHLKPCIKNKSPDSINALRN